MLPWREGALKFPHAAFDSVRVSLERLGGGAWPDADALNGALNGASNRRGARLRFVEAGVEALAGQHYELRIAQSGEIATRANWHDLFNALAWTAFPATKAAISETHARIIESGGEEELKRRSVARDVLTLFDENGAIVVSESHELLEDLRGFRWKRLFGERRAECAEKLRVYLFGHAIMEKMLDPHIGVTAKCLLFEAPRGWLESHDARVQVRELDARAAEYLLDPTHLVSTRSLQPLPVLGIPGWDARNQDHAFYDNKDYFRPGYLKARKSTQVQ
jgi:hypothetical protein